MEASGWIEEGLGVGAGKGTEPVFNNYCCLFQVRKNKPLNKMQGMCPGAHLAFIDQAKPRRADPVASEGLAVLCRAARDWHAVFEVDPMLEEGGAREKRFGTGDKNSHSEAQR